MENKELGLGIIDVILELVENTDTDPSTETDPTSEASD